MARIQNMPEELLSEVLSYVFCLSPCSFAGPAYHDFFGCGSCPLRPVPGTRRSSTLLVSKQWLRVGTPLLFESVSISKPEHSERLLEAVKDTPYLGKVVKRIDISGGMGPSLGTFLSLAQGIRTLKLQIYVGGEDDVSGVCRGLAQIAPSRLLIDIKPMRHFNEREQQVVNTLVSVIPHWTTLERVDLVRSPDPWFFYALKKSPSLRYLCMSRFEVYNFMKTWPCSESIITLPTFKYVIARDLNPAGAAAQRKIFEDMHPKGSKYIISDQECPRDGHVEVNI